MFNARAIVALLVAPAAFATPAWAQTEARLIPIAARSVSDGNTYGLVLSADGSTVAGTTTGPGPVIPGSVLCRWTLATGMAAFPRSGIQPASQASDAPIALSTDGSVIGCTVGHDQHMVARWTLESGFQVAPQLDTGNQQTDGKAMSADGRFIVGTGSINGGSRAFLADMAGLTNTNLQNVGAPVNMTSAVAYSISAAGDKVVGLYLPTGGVWQVSSLWENAATRTDLACPPQFTHWFLFLISGDGRVLIGSAELPAHPLSTVPIRWSAQEGAAFLPTLPGSSNWVPRFVNSAGDTVAGRCRVNNDQYATLWLPDGSVTTVDAYCEAHGLLLPGEHFSDVGGLSSDGRVVLVWGNQENGMGRECMLRLAGAMRLCASDLGRTGGMPGPDGQLDNNDFIAFISCFFARNAKADVGGPGGLRGSDFLLDNNDFVAFIDLFFHGCE